VNPREKATLCPKGMETEGNLIVKFELKAEEGSLHHALQFFKADDFSPDLNWQIDSISASFSDSLFIKTILIVVHNSENYWTRCA
jgi:hypothetical protein